MPRHLECLRFPAKADAGRINTPFHQPPTNTGYSTMTPRKTPTSDKKTVENKVAMNNKNVAIYNLAREYLLSILPDGMKKSDLDKYFHGEDREPESLKDVFIQLIASAQNRRAMPKAIKFNDRKKEIGRILYDFDFVKTAQMDLASLHKQFCNVFHSEYIESSHDSWRIWSNAVIDSAKFISEFKDLKDFKGFVNLFYCNARTRIALPLYISTKIKGIGFALACDALKELGYTQYPKPDGHIINTCYELGLSSKNGTSNEAMISAFEAVVKMAEDNEVTPYQVDKVLWLIGSGNFYNNGISIPGHREDFLKKAKKLFQ